MSGHGLRCIETPCGSCAQELVAEIIAQLDEARAREAGLRARVSALARDWTQATCITDGAPCSFHRQAPGYAADLRAALAEDGTTGTTESGETL